MFPLQEPYIPFQQEYTVDQHGGQRQEQEEREETECYERAEDSEALPQHLCGRVW